MILALIASTVWMLGGAALLAALYWAFLNTPESTAFMLALSLLLGLAMYAVLSLTWTGALLGWSRGWSRGEERQGAREWPRVWSGGAVNGVVAFLPALAFVLAVYWLVGHALGWMDAQSGEIGAWFIATFDWTNVQPLLAGAHYLGEWLRWLVAPFAALVWLAATLSSGWSSRPDLARLGRALSPTRLVLATVVAGFTLALPLGYFLYWVPPGLPPTWVQPAFAIAKLAVMAVLGAAGLSMIAKLAARGAR